jgi:hypothetical protein
MAGKTGAGDAYRGLRAKERRFNLSVLADWKSPRVLICFFL